MAKVQFPPPLYKPVMALKFIVCPVIYLEILLRHSDCTIHHMIKQSILKTLCLSNWLCPFSQGKMGESFLWQAHQMNLQWPGCEVDHPSPSNVAVKNEWNHTFTLPLCLHGMEKDNCHFTISFIIILIPGHFTVLYYTLRACKFLLYNKSLVERSHVRFHRK